MICPKCGFNLFSRNTDGDDVCVRCGKVIYSNPILQPRIVIRPTRRKTQEVAREQHNRNGWGAKEFMENLGVSKVTAYRWLREWGSEDVPFRL